MTNSLICCAMLNNIDTCVPESNNKQELIKQIHSFIEDKKNKHWMSKEIYDSCDDVFNSCCVIYASIYSKIGDELELAEQKQCRFDDIESDETKLLSKKLKSVKYLYWIALEMQHSYKSRNDLFIDNKDQLRFCETISLINYVSLKFVTKISESGSYSIRRHILVDNVSKAVLRLKQRYEQDFINYEIIQRDVNMIIDDIKFRPILKEKFQDIMNDIFRDVKYNVFNFTRLDIDLMR